MTFISVLLLTYFIFISFNKNKIEMAERITTVENLDKAWVPLEDSHSESVLSLITKSFGSMIIKFSPGYKSAKNRKLLEKAGVLRETTAEKYIAKKTVLMMLIALISGVVTVYMINDWSMAFVLAILTTLLVNTFYKFYLGKRITKRTEEIVKALPFSLDLITVSVEAGLSLDGAIGRIVGTIEGPLSDEFGITLKEMRMGIEKKDALKNMSERVGDKDLSMLLSSIIQADELGVSLGKLLRIEGDQLREKRKQAAKEKAMKAPIKMLFPLMIFIFPTIFVIVLGPAFIQMADFF
jgi:tight adherence protein C